MWSEGLVMDRAGDFHIERTSWKQHEEVYMRSMTGMWSRLRWAREAWARGIFRIRRLCGQFHAYVDAASAVDPASALLICMQRSGSIAIGFTLQVKRACYGMVHDRAPHERRQAHWRPGISVRLNTYA